MTRSEIRSKTLKFVDEDPAQTFRYISDTDANNAIAMALRIFCFLTLCSEATGNLTIQPGESHTLILSTLPNFILPLRVTIDGVLIYRSSLERIEALASGWRNDPAPPERYAMIGANAIAIQPIQSSITTATVNYARFAPVLANDNDVPDIPNEDHDFIAEGAAAIVAGTKLGGQGDASARQRLESFFTGIKRRAGSVRERNKMNRYEALPAEVSKELLKKLLESFK